MAGPGKILTISYGAFRCTLEDFEDPLQTMTAILDYLRYLDAIAGGAVSSAPDPDILTRIAMRGVEDSVEAQMHAGGLVLRSLPARGAADRFADAQGHAAPRYPEDPPDTAPPDAAPSESTTRDQAPAQDDLSRIFAQTDTQLETPASSRRRNAIQHARAALAATRPVDHMSEPPWPGDVQRIDMPRGTTGASCSDPEDFGSFVARTGAAGLPELIEAAAAYLTDIEGVTRLSRPMLIEVLIERLGQIAQVWSREDMRRACDALLAQGKLRICPDGLYAITDKTGFRAKPRTDPENRSH